MDKDKIVEIINDIENKSNKDLFGATEILIDEHKKTKDLIIDLINHLDVVEDFYEKIQKEINKRKIKL